METLVAGEQTLLLLAVLSAIVTLGVWMESRPRLAQYGVLAIILVPALLGALSVLPRQADIYGLISHYLLPMAIPLLLFKADLPHIWRESGRLFIAFLVAASATVIGALVALTLITPGKDGGVWAGIMTAGFIGGSANTAAVAAAMDKAADPFVGVMVAGAYTVGLSYMVFLLIVPSIGWIWRLLSPGDDYRSYNDKTAPETREGITALSLVKAITLSAIIVSVADVFQQWTESGAIKYLIITVLSVGFASLLPRQASKLYGHYELGQIMIYLFFAVLGAQVDFAMALADQGRDVVLFCSILLLIHFVLLAIVGRLLKLNGPELVIASNACILGPPTAAAMAIARGWHQLATPGILCGLLGYAIANIVGITMAGLI